MTAAAPSHNLTNAEPSAFAARLAEHYAELSAKLRIAGDYIAKNPVDTASRSLRNVADSAGVAPATFTRLAKALDYPSFDNLRDSLRDQIGDQVHKRFSQRASHIPANASFAHQHIAACQTNIQQLWASISDAQLESVADALSTARQVHVYGGLGAAGFAEYCSYLTHFLTDNWTLVERPGASLGGVLAGIGDRDALVLVTKSPFSSRGCRAAEIASAQGAYVLVITDTYACPALQHADSHFLVSAESPHFYSSYVATLALIEILIGMVVGRASREAHNRIAAVEQNNRLLNEVWDD